MNKVILMGRLTKDPEVKYTQQNVAVARYSIAVARRFQQKGQPEVDFINCIAFGKSAEFAQKYLNKGKQIAITEYKYALGKMKTVKSNGVQK